MKAKWREVKLGDVLHKVDAWISPSPGGTYKEVTVKLWGRGVVLRREVEGSEIAGQRRLKVSRNQFILSRIDARNGALGLVPDDLEGALVTNDFPSFEVNADRLMPEFLGLLSKTKAFVESCRRASEGTTNRVRLKEDKFLHLPIALPPLHEQRRIVAGIDQIMSRIDETLSLKARQETEINAALLSAFHRIAGQAPRKPMREVAPQVRRPIRVLPLENYPELGIRSFGHGTFHKPILTGFEIGSKRIFQIEPGDLLFSNVFAWEGAIAVARPEDAGRVGSHRYITCVPRPALVTSSFLRFYFLTSEGLEKIGAASPGGAGRNRTLGLKALDEIKVPVPSMKAQLWFDELQSKANDIETVQSQMTAGLNVLLPSILDRALIGEI